MNFDVDLFQLLTRDRSSTFLSTVR